ncbi:MAG: L-threonylcarbamoyladenylate synthase [Lactobacillaceae bacterium]|jgi:L-threonylcarbamoyladenylate synthase|nr:L-threonylcarbamoyladenylate synthase [Lactobacillaceae bacterium]
MTEILSNSINDIKHAAEIILQGGVVAIPTDTLYGLAALNDQQVANIKGRSLKEKPISWLVNIIPTTFSSENKKIAELFWPGALTIIDKGIGYRKSDDYISQKIIELVRQPITGTSANLTNQTSNTTAAGVLLQLEGKIDAIVVDDSLPKGMASTVVQDGKILRQGAIYIDL